MTIQRNQIITAHRNPNRHTQRGIGLLESSMREDGYVAPMTAAANGEVLDGNARRETIEQVFPDADPIIVESDGTRPIVHVRRDIPDSETAIARRIMYRANRIGQIDLSWDATLLLKDIEAGIDFKSLGFNQAEINMLVEENAEVDYSKEWQGMPEFEQEDLTAYKSIKVNFATPDDVRIFSELIGQDIVERKQSIWYPEKKREKLADLVAHEQP